MATKRGQVLPGPRLIPRSAMTGLFHQGPHVTYQLQWRTCGKPRCRCHLRGELHGSYWYGYYWQDGVLRSVYIGKKRPPGMTEEEVARQEQRAQQTRERQLAGALVSEQA